MNWSKKIFNKNKDKGNRAIPDSELALDSDYAWSFISNSGAGAAYVGLSLDKQRVFFSMKQSFAPEEIISLRKAIEEGMVHFDAQVYEMATYPIIILKSTIFDRPEPQNAFWIETFPDIGSSDKVTLETLARAGNQTMGPSSVSFHFFTPKGNLALRAGFRYFFPNPDIKKSIAEADLYLSNIPSDLRNYSEAAKQLLRENPGY